MYVYSLCVFRLFAGVSYVADDLKLVEIMPEEEPAAGEPLKFMLGQRGCTLLVVDGFSFVRNRRSGYKTYWICSKKVISSEAGEVVAYQIGTRLIQRYVVHFV